MKKSLVLLIIVLLVGTIRGYSQRCLPGQSGIEVFGGWGDGYPLMKKKNLDCTVGIAYFRYMQNQNKYTVGIEYMEKMFCYKCNSVPLNQFLLSGGYSHNFLSNRVKSLFLNISGTLLVGYESINWGKKNFCDGAKLLNKNAFVAGGNIGIEFESYVTNRFLFSLQVKEKLLLNSMKTFHFQYGISFKYILR